MDELNQTLAYDVLSKKMIVNLRALVIKEYTKERKMEPQLREICAKECRTKIEKWRFFETTEFHDFRAC